MQQRAILSRRALLGLAALTASGLLDGGCGKHKRPAAAKPVVVPDAAALNRARDGERLLLASYDAKIAHAAAHELPRLQVARAIHATHLSALHGRASTGSEIAVVTNIRAALRRSVQDLRGLALAATSGANAAVLASIAASHETSAR